MGINRGPIRIGQEAETVAHPILIIDANNMGHRALHTTGPLSYRGVPTGVIFGIFSQTFSLLQKFHPSNVVFCWDSRESIRREKVPSYKANRRSEAPPPELLEAFQQFERLREEIFPTIGLVNQFQHSGYEADDLIAQLAIDYPQQCVICSSDDDLLQLLPWADIYSPGKKKLITRELFQQEWQLSPHNWAGVKAIAGCPGDNVIGVPGIGQKTAVEYLNGKLKQGGKKSEAIQSFTQDRWEENLWLVELPLPGTPSVRIQPSKFNQQKFEKICTRLGFHRLRGMEDWHLYL